MKAQIDKLTHQDMEYMGDELRSYVCEEFLDCYFRSLTKQDDQMLLYDVGSPTEKKKY